jgi:hypothetical protein
MHPDRDGRELTVGDRVMVLGTVQAIFGNDEGTNIVVHTESPREPGGRLVEIKLNSRQVVRVEGDPPGPTAPALASA